MNARPTERGKRATNREPRVLVRIPYRRCQWKCGMAYMPPLQTPGTAYTSREPGNASNTHGPHTCGPYEPTGNNRQTGKAGVCRRPARLRTRAGFQNGSPDEPCRQERNGIVTESLCLVRNVNRLGRPQQTSGVSKGARRTWGKAGGPEAPNRLPDGSRCKERGRSNTVCIASLSDAADAAGW